MTKLFEGLTKMKGDKKQYSRIAGNTRPIEEWFRLFLQIVDNEKMIKVLHKSLKVVLPEDKEKGERI